MPKEGESRWKAKKDSLPNEPQMREPDNRFDRQIQLTLRVLVWYISFLSPLLFRERLFQDTQRKVGMFVPLEW
ncbi:hypothetical protein CPB86DRAFT_821156 [Serendipita vermifera]|nr:hypothetical protein CPB86DRAFT_821156 [Serendipita vermifera]